MWLRSLDGGRYDLPNERFLFRASTRSKRIPGTYTVPESPPDSPPASPVRTMVEGQTSLDALIATLESAEGLQYFKTAYRANMRYKAQRYAELRAEADRAVALAREVIELQMPELKRLANIPANDSSDNWNIFESVSQHYRDARLQATQFEALEARAKARLQGSMAHDAVGSRTDHVYVLRDRLVESLQHLRVFSDQTHIMQTISDSVSTFLKDPVLFRRRVINMVLLGGAGTGKTSIARAIAHVLARAGMFISDNLIEAGRAELVAQYEGQTVARTRNFLVSNLDNGVVFIDEAYAITPWSNGRPEGYGSEAATAMVEFMLSYTGLYCIIAAGYEREMMRYFIPSNPGLFRRFAKYLVLEQKSPEELVRVFKMKLVEHQGVCAIEPLASERYFTTDAYRYLTALIRESLTETVEWVTEHDTATLIEYHDVRKSTPKWPLLFALFKNQAGSMDLLAVEALDVLMSTHSFADARADCAEVPQARNFRSQVKSVMRDVIVQRIINTSLTLTDAALEQLAQVDARIA